MGSMNSGNKLLKILHSAPLKVHCVRWWRRVARVGIATMQLIETVLPFAKFDLFMNIF